MPPPLAPLTVDLPGSRMASLLVGEPTEKHEVDPAVVDTASTADDTLTKKDKVLELGHGKAAETRAKSVSQKVRRKSRKSVPEQKHGKTTGKKCKSIAPKRACRPRGTSLTTYHGTGLITELLSLSEEGSEAWSDNSFLSELPSWSNEERHKQVQKKSDLTGVTAALQCSPLLPQLYHCIKKGQTYLC